jgi:predicted metal-dependent HD superfamily phosphohydrolase
MLHHLCMTAVHSRLLHELAHKHPDIDSAYFDDMRLALLNCSNEFSRIYPPARQAVSWDEAIDQMESERV